MVFLFSSAVYIPGNARKAISLHYFSGNCMSSATQRQIENQFIQLLNQSVFNQVCRDEQFKDKCKADNVKVTCGVVGISSGRKKRSSPTYIITIEYEAVGMLFT